MEKRAPSFVLVNGVTIGACGLLLLLDVWPHSLICGIVLMFPVVAVTGLIWFFKAVGALQSGRPRRAATAPLIAILAGLCLWLHVPRRAAFLAARSAFETSAAELLARPDHPTYDRAEQRIGLWKVASRAADESGGVYFAVGSLPDGLGPDQFIFGFAYRPDASRSAYGRKGYSRQHLWGDWYSFRASDDY